MASVDDVMSAMEAAVQAQGEALVKQVKGIIAYDVGGTVYTLNLKEGSGALHRGKVGTPDVTITVTDKVFLQLADGSLNPQQAFMRGTLKLKGNMALALKLNAVMDAARKAMGGGATSGAGATAPTVPAAPAPSAAVPSSIGAGLKSGATFEAIQAAIAREGPSLVKAVGGVITFDITAPAARFTIDLKNGSGSFVTGDASAKADLTITVSDEDFSLMAAGKLNAQQAFMKGKLKIKGAMALAMKLQTVLDAARKGPAPKL